jgi:hypothetical protein
LGINKAGHHAFSDMSRALSSVWTSLTKTRVVHFAAALVLLAIGLQLCRIGSANSSRVSDDFVARFAPFSLLSLSIVYILTVVFDPYQCTFSDSRMSAPLLYHGAVWAVILLRRSLACPGPAKYIVLACILAGLLPSTNIARGASYPRDHTQVKGVYREMEHDLSTVAKIEDLRVCIVDGDYFSALHSLLKPTLYAKRRVVLQSAHPPLRGCDVVFARRDPEYFTGENFKKAKSYVIDGRNYTLFVSNKSREP